MAGCHILTVRVILAGDLQCSSQLAKCIQHLLCVVVTVVFYFINILVLHDNVKYVKSDIS